MKKLRVTFLGTGTSQGVPVIACNCEVCLSKNPKDHRLRTSILLSFNNHNVVIDTGPDFRQQMLREKVDQLHAVLFTHEHKDHTAGMDDIRAYNHLNNRPMEIYASSQVQSALKREFQYVFDGTDYPGIPKVNLNTIVDETFYLFEEKITPIKVWHHQLPVYGFRIKNFTYITDANYIDETNIEKIKGSEVIVVNALRIKKHISHFTLNEALQLIENIAPKKAYLIHISHLLGLHEKVSNELPENVDLAYDGLSIMI